MCKATDRNNTTVVSSSSDENNITSYNKEQPQEPKKTRVSFKPTVRVHVIQRLDSFTIREVFYQPSDFRRFRSEACIEILEARADRDREPWKSMLRRLREFVSSSSCSSANDESSSQSNNNNAFQYYYQPIPTPHEQQQQQQQRILSSRGSNSSCTAELLKQKSPETVVRELAFVV